MSNVVASSRREGDQDAMEIRHVVSRDEWLVARKELLVKEKESTMAREALNAERRALPMVEIDKEYVFEGPDGKASLLDLFEGMLWVIIWCGRSRCAAARE